MEKRSTARRSKGFPLQPRHTTPSANGRFTRTLAALFLALGLCFPALPGCTSTENAPRESYASRAAEVESSVAPASSQADVAESAAAKLSDIPEYSGALCIDVNDGQPGFTADDVARGSFMDFSELDFEGRCGTAFGLIGPDTISHAERGDISQVHPSGWVQHRYSFVDREMLYNRSHLIAHQLCGENANDRNLITGTRTMNARGMTYYENIVASYVQDSNNHVLYRVTPIFAAYDLVARGVQIEAESVEDGGRAVRFNVFVYNVEPGVEIDYVTGDNWGSSATPAVATDGDATMTRGSGVDTRLGAASSNASAGGDASAGGIDLAAHHDSDHDGSHSTEHAQTYVLNTKSRKFHRPDCESALSMSSANKQDFTGSRQTLIDEGYTPCKSCNP